MRYKEEILGDVIRYVFISRRHELGLTQENLSLIANTTRQFISQVEGGKRQPSLFSLSHFATAVNMTLSELFQEIDRIYLDFTDNGADF
ncbi:MAG: helix-turn-helix transcriptional regulator [Fibrobacter sp.]|nr:helix-turn-helix transcriptional regulator [Fibrobacter sp.]